MSTRDRVPVIGRDGLRGCLEASGVPGDGPGKVAVRLDDGRRLLVPGEALRRCPDGSYTLELGREEVDRITGRATTETIPFVAEELEVGKRTIETGRLRLARVVREREETVDVPLLREEVEVRRVPVGKVVEAPPAVRQEGETTIIPLVEEVLVVEKRLILREELHVRRWRSEEHRPQVVTLRSEEAIVDRQGRE